MHQDATANTPINQPKVRGFDSGELFREDCLIRLEELSKEIAKDLRK
jgi:hypothetical protein